MSQSFQFSLQVLLKQVALLAVGMACLRLVGERSGALVSGCYFELSAVAFGSALGILTKRAVFFAALFALLAAPFSLKAMEVVTGINV